MTAGPPHPGPWYPPPGGQPSAGYPPPGYPSRTETAAPPRATYTSWVARVCAALIDLIPVAVAAAVNQWVAITTAGVDCVVYGNGGLVCTGTPSTTGLLTGWLVGVATLLYVLLNVGWAQGVKGASLGKTLLRCRVVNATSGRPVGFWVSLLRLALHAVDALPCFVGFLWPLWDRRRQTFADKIVSTVCVPRGSRRAAGFSGRR